MGLMFLPIQLSSYEIYASWQAVGH